MQKQLSMTVNRTFNPAATQKFKREITQMRDKINQHLDFRKSVVNGLEDTENMIRRQVETAVNKYNPGLQTWKKLWEFEDSTILMNISGLTIDKHSTIYVASRGNNSIVVISPDGEKGRCILGKEDGITDPRGIFINEENDTLLVTNYNGTAFLYQNAMISELFRKLPSIRNRDFD
ncbi:unnamed protein product [Mytilus edulis]|uniref:Uncharacterized protein n=1 Tax=Mytilus edulis TaxID=6550 RepID=A0A8S3UCP1_MYTED|nr:unnamed protein product [Mytilus edulis]